MSELRPRIIERDATLVLELLTPLHVGSGERDGISDAGVVRDFNLLPGIPGPSIQGMLRSAVTEACGDAIAVRIFGDTTPANRGSGRGGRLSVSWGVIHNSKNNPVKSHLTPARRDTDGVLRDAARPMLRDHARHNERGVAANRGKFDELVVSAGHRFTIRLRFVTAGTDPEADWFILEKVLKGPGLRLGGKTRRGLGAFEIKCWKDTPDSHQPSETSQSDACDSFKPLDEDDSLSRSLTPETLWMFGGGTSDSADSAPASGTRIQWTKDADGKEGGSVRPIWIIAGSSVKGALAHRTRFHANRLAKNFADQTNDPSNEQKKKEVEAWMIELFGTTKGDTGIPGKVFIDDVSIDIPTNNDGAADLGQHLAPVQNHVAINPFTGGAKDGALFNDQPLDEGIATIPLRVLLRGNVTAEARKSLEAAIDDLAAGRLALGAHAGRGYGVFKGTPRQSA